MEYATGHFNRAVVQWALLFFFFHAPPSFRPPPHFITLNPLPPRFPSLAQSPPGCQ